MKYRVLDTSKGIFLDSENVVVKPNGEILENSTVSKKSLQVQTALTLLDRNGRNIFIGDAIKAVVKNQGPNNLSRVIGLLKMEHFHTIPEKFDELIIQITSDEDGLMYYWVLFKSNGQFVRNKDCNFGEDVGTEPEDLRAIPSDGETIFRKLSSMNDLEVVYNCTDKEWIERFGGKFRFKNLEEK